VCPFHRDADSAFGDGGQPQRRSRAS
jgi:hypothetical protein